MSNERKLWCLAELDRAAFEVICQDVMTTPISGLVTLIKEAIGDKMTPSRDFIVWKPTKGMIPVIPVVDVGKRVKELGTDFAQFAEVLEMEQPVATYFQDVDQTPTNPRLNVIIQHPAQRLGKRSRCVDGTDLAWLRELHTKIWNQKFRRSELFREVTVTHADYTALEGCLKALHADRDEEDYHGGRYDVLSHKLSFLRSRSSDKGTFEQHQEKLRQQRQQELPSSTKSLPPQALPPQASSSRHANPNDDDEASSEEDTVIKSFFPYLLLYMDLSPLALKEIGPSLFASPLLYRKEYEFMSGLIKKKSQNSSGSVVVSGQPGVGKTAYLYLMIIEKMIEGDPFLFQAQGGTVYYVGEKDVEVAQSSSWSPDEAIVALVDGDEHDSGPDRFIRQPFVQLIVASAPNVENQRWIKRLGPGATISLLVMNLWDERELFLTGIFLTPLDLRFKLLKESTSYFGYNPRRCFEASISATQMTEKSDQLKDLIRETPKSTDLMQLFYKSRSGGSNVSDGIFQIFPRDPKQLIVHCLYEAVSRWALDLLLQAYEVAKAHVAAEFYYNISAIPGTDVLLGHILERQVLNYLCRGDKHDFGIRRSSDSNRTSWFYPEGVRYIKFHESTISSKIMKAVDKRKRVLMIPLARNFPAVDAIFYDLEDQDSPLTCIQITKNTTHNIAVSGLRQIQSWLKRGTPLHNLRPSKGRPWRFVFIVPSDMADEYNSQNVVNQAGKTEGVADWPEKIQQYVLGLGDGTIFDSSATSSQQGDQRMEED